MKKKFYNLRARFSYDVAQINFIVLYYIVKNLI